jgi:aarF domain-containing kinase
LRADLGSFPKRASQRKHHPRRNLSTTNAEPEKKYQKQVKAYVTVPATLLAVGALGYLTYENYQPFRHTVLAVVRCSRVAGMGQLLLCCRMICLKYLLRGCGVRCYRL